MRLGARGKLLASTVSEKGNHSRDWSRGPTGSNWPSGRITPLPVLTMHRENKGRPGDKEAAPSMMPAQDDSEQDEGASFGAEKSDRVLQVFEAQSADGWDVGYEREEPKSSETWKRTALSRYGVVQEGHLGVGEFGVM